MGSRVPYDTHRLDAARQALQRLHTMAMGHDYANEADLRREFEKVDDALDVLEDLIVDRGDRTGILDEQNARAAESEGVEPKR